VLGADFGELSEDLGLEVWDLGDGFDDHVHVGEVGHVGCRVKAGASGFGVGFADALLGDVFGEELVGEREAFVKGGLGGVDEGNGDGGFLRSDEGDAETLVGGVSFVCWECGEGAVPFVLRRPRLVSLLRMPSGKWLKTVC
jgi:hypothetical protein